MKPKYYISITILALVLTGAFYIQSQSTNVQSERTYPSTSNFDSFQIHEIKQGNFTSGNFNVEGYIVEIYTCLPCPPDAFCKPCMGDNIIISEGDNFLEGHGLTKSELLIFADDPNQFELGKKYRFSVKILDSKSTGEPLNDIELVGYDLN